MRWFALLIALAISASAEEASRRILHEGAEMVLKVSGDDIEIAYIEPPVDLREIGVAAGQVLVAGSWMDRDPPVLVGHAYVFAPRCPPIAYEIRGIIEFDGALLVVGPTPVLKPASCEIAQLAWTAGSIMQFAASATEREQERERKKKPRREKPAAEEKPKPKPAPAKPKSKPKPQRPQPQIYSPPYYQQPSPWRW